MKIHFNIEKIVEDTEWSDIDKIDDNKLLENDKYERVAELKRQFMIKRIEQSESDFKNGKYLSTDEILVKYSYHKTKN